MLPREVPVLIVGGGPSGTLAALLLERMGVETALVERGPSLQRAPTAQVVNARTFEICRQAGVDMGALARHGKSPEDAGWAYFVTKLGGRVLGRLPFEQQGDDQLARTPHPLRNLSQNHFEPALVRALERFSGKAPLWGHAWEDGRREADGVVSQVRGPDGAVHEVRSRWLVGADGAGSRVRKWLGIEPVGPDRIRSFVMIHFHAKLRGLPEVPPGVLFFTTDPDTGFGTFVIHDLDREAVYMHPFEPESESLEEYDPARCTAIVRAALEQPDLELSVQTVSSWTMTAQVAERYREGPVFLVGDAAHRFPPTGGLGLSSGAQDVHNLAWKLAAVERRELPASLLDTYERERRPVARTNADQSLRNALKLIEVPRALGTLEPEGARDRMEATLASAEGRARVEAAVADQAEHFDMPGLQLGFWYPEGAVAREDDARPPGDGEVRRFTPSGCPGARLPHAWLDPARTASLLDLVPLDRFLLLAGPEGEAWAEAVVGLDVPDTVVFAFDETSLVDLDGWLATAGIGRDGALLVRPDQHVAWRAPAAVSDPGPVLVRAFERILGG